MSTSNTSAPEIAIVPSEFNSWRDWLGITASVGCAIHCAAMPFVFAWLPALGLSFLADESFHKWMALICFLIAIVAFIPGLRKHGNWTPVLVGTIGWVLIALAAFGLAGECCAGCEAKFSTSANTDVESSGDSGLGLHQCSECDSCEQNNHPSEIAVTSTSDEKQDWLSILTPWITPAGGLLLVSAHLLNRRYGCLCGCC